MITSLNTKASVKTFGIVIILFLLVIVITSVILINFKTTGLIIKEDKTIKIGAIFPLSGPSTYYGLQAQKGVETAKEKINQEYPDLNFEVIYEDSQYNPKIGVDSYKKLKEINNIDAVITEASPVSLAIQPLSNKDNVLEMAIASTSPKYSTPDDLSFRTIPSMEIQTVKIINFLNKKSYTRLGILYVNDDYGKGGKDTLKKELSKQTNIVIVGEQNFLGSDNDYRTQIAKLKESNPQAVYLVGTAANYVNILEQANELGLKTQFISVASTESPVLLKAGSSAEGIIYTYYNIDPNTNSQAKDFIDSYKKKYKEEPEGYAAEGYEAIRLTALAFKQCGKDSKCIKNYLINLKGYDSVFGKLSFDNNGDVYYDFIFKTVKNGQFVRYED